MKLKELLVGGMLLHSLSANAAINELSHHSRAQCFGNNETISWHLGHYYWMVAESLHFNARGVKHIITSEYLWHWRSSGRHFMEPSDSDVTKVRGNHYMSFDNGKHWGIFVVTIVTDCSIYDGWWDF